jgi:site-specific DNA recombinase
MPKAVAVYARISQDRSGEGLGVARQLADCRAEVERRGWTVSSEYVDDDTSAYSGKDRPAYRQLLAALLSGECDAVVVWHLDRLHRRPVELEEFVTTCTKAGVTDVVTLHGDFDIGNGDGLLVARLMAAVAANESDAKARRSRRKMLELAQAGKPHGGGWRSFGFEQDRVTVNDAEASLIRQLAARTLAGESLTSLCRWLQASEVPTVGGKQWRTGSIKTLLLSPRIAGLRTYQGQVIGPAAWPAIISVSEHEQLQLLLTDPARRTNRTARRYLLSGLVRCSLCGATMVSVPKDAYRRYLCRSGVHAGGCGRLAITADPLEVFVSEAVLLRLDSPALHDALVGRAPDAHQAGDLSRLVAEDSAQLDELARMYAAKDITAAEWLVARKEVEARRAANRRLLSQAAGSAALNGLLGNGDALRASWAGLNLTRQVAIIKAVVQHVSVRQGRAGARALDPDRFDIVWQV